GTAIRDRIQEQLKANSRGFAYDKNGEEEDDEYYYDYSTDEEEYSSGAEEPISSTKEGKRFGFVRFINVFNVDRFTLHANKARFQRATLNKGQGADHKKFANSPRPNSGDYGSSNSYVNAVKNHKSVPR
ncbi:hypothetical protein Tco_0914962, partial [Tanacetum coccineum]